MIRITNGKIVLPDTILEGYDLIIKDEQIYDIVKKDEIGLVVDEAKETINAHGGYVTPGFIDIHADYIEHMAAPRPTSLIDFNIAIREAERELLTHGVTTMFHSLSLYKDKVDVKAVRRPENVEELTNIIYNAHYKKHLIRHRFHARLEIDNIEGVEQLKTHIEANKVHMLSFMDHTPGQGQYRDIEGFKRTMKKYDPNLTELELNKRLEERMNKEKLSVSQCKELADFAKAKGIAVASHDDDTVSKLEANREIGVSISEFPITLEVAKRAKEMGFYTIAGAPNILLGGSHSGNLSAHEAIKHDAIDVLCSDYYPAGILHSIFKLHKVYGHELSKMFKLVTLNPAKAVNLDHEIGSIERGKRADVLIIETIEEDFPVITSCIVDGKHVFQTNYRG